MPRHLAEGLQGDPCPPYLLPAESSPPCLILGPALGAHKAQCFSFLLAIPPDRGPASPSSPPSCPRGRSAPTRIQGGGDLGKGPGTACLHLTDQRQRVARVLGRPGRLHRPSALPRLVEVDPVAEPRAFAAWSAALVRTEIRARSFSARAAYRCSMNGSASAPRSATMNGTFCAIRPEM